MGLHEAADQVGHALVSVFTDDEVQGLQEVDGLRGGVDCGGGGVVLLSVAVHGVVLAKEVVGAEETKNIGVIGFEVRQGAYTAAACEVAALKPLPCGQQGAEGAVRVDGEEGVEEGVEAENGVVAHHEVGSNSVGRSSHAQGGLLLNMVGVQKGTLKKV